MRKHFLKSGVALLIASIFIIAGCNDENHGEIKIDETKAKENIIPIDQARQYTASFRRAKDEFYKQYPVLDSQFNLPRAEWFNKDAIAALLRADKVGGVRIYFGRDDKGQVRLVLLPTDDKGNDIIGNLINKDRKEATAQKSSDSQQAFGAAGDGEAVELGQRCPDYCSPGGGM